MSTNNMETYRLRPACTRTHRKRSNIMSLRNVIILHEDLADDVRQQENLADDVRQHDDLRVVDDDVRQHEDLENIRQHEEPEIEAVQHENAEYMLLTSSAMLFYN